MLAIALAASVALAAPATTEVGLERTFPAGSASTSTKTEAPAFVLGGTFVILATVNGTATLRIDSGTTHVLLPRTVAARLIRAGSLTHADYMTIKTYRLADGSLCTQIVYRLRSLKVGTLIAARHSRHDQQR